MKRQIKDLLLEHGIDEAYERAKANMYVGESSYQGLFDTTDGRKGWFDISKAVYQGFVNGKKGLCQDVRRKK